MNIFDSLKEIITTSVIEKIADFHSEKPTKIQQASDIASAAIVGGMIKRITSDTGMNLCYNVIQKNTFQVSDLTNLKSSEDFSEIITLGDKTLNTLLPSFKSPVSGLVSKNTGLRSSAAASIVSFITLSVVTVLKKKIAEKNLDASAMASFLGEQREYLLNVVPDLNQSLIDTVGLQYVLANFTAPQNKVDDENIAAQNVASPRFTYDTPEVEKTDFTPYLKWVGIGLGILGAVALGYYFWNQKSSVSDSDKDSTETTQNEARTIVEPVVKDSLKTQVLADTSKKVSLNLFEAYLADATKPKGKTLKMEGVDFEDNTTQLKLASKGIIENLTGLMKKYPAAEIKFIDYTNDAQSPNTNRILSVKRAFALKQQLIDGGISYVRVDAEGRSNGINPKDTTGRKQVPLREVYLKFVKK